MVFLRDVAYSSKDFVGGYQALVDHMKIDLGEEAEANEAN